MNEKLGDINWNVEKQQVKGLDERGECCICTPTDCWTKIFGYPAKGRDIFVFDKLLVMPTIGGWHKVLEYKVPKGRTAVIENFGYELLAGVYSGYKFRLVKNGEPLKPFNEITDAQIAGVRADLTKKTHILLKADDVLSFEFMRYIEPVSAQVCSAAISGVLLNMKCIE